MLALVFFFSECVIFKTVSLKAVASPMVVAGEKLPFYVMPFLRLLSFFLHYSAQIRASALD